VDHAVTKFTYEIDDVLFDYVAHGNPKSNEHLKRYLRRYPQLREEIVDFTAYWRALSILEKVLPPVTPDPAVERQLLRRAQARLRALRRRRRLHRFESSGGTVTYVHACKPSTQVATEAPQGSGPPALRGYRAAARRRRP
jgi:hypothetical protein